MSLCINPASAESDFVAEVGDIDLRRIDADTVQEIDKAMQKYAVLIFHRQNFSNEEQISFSERFGSLGISYGALNPDRELRFDNRISDISNFISENQMAQPTDRRWQNSLANRLWHTDASFKPLPAKYSMLSARVVTSWGGETEFADLRAAYDALPQWMKAKIEDLVALHSQTYSHSRLGFANYSAIEAATHKPQPQLVVRVLPDSGRKTLYLGSHAGDIEGMTVAEGRMLLIDLTEHATQPLFVHRHHWKAGDFVIWDNRCTMHRGRYFDMSEVRDMRRTTTNDIGSTLEQRKMQEGSAQKTSLPVQ